MTASYETHEHDVLIIGAGGAGLRAALEALAQGARVGLVCKSLLGKAHTVMAEGGIAAAMGNVDKSDDWRTHFRDTMRGGKFLNNWRMAQLHAQEAPDRVRELEQWGALFDRTPTGDILQRAFGGHTFKRLCHVGDRTGLELIRTLQDRGVELGIDVFMECTVTRLLKDGDRVAGAFGYWREQGRFVAFKAKSVVIATGGIGKAWRVTSNSWEYTADGMALAYEAGAELMDMEFVQFHPTGMVWPPGVQGILVTEAVRGEGGILRNKLGERFMEKYDPKRMELSTRDVVARSIYTEVKEGRGTEHGGAYLDISHKPAEYVKKKLPSMYHQFKELADVDITKGPMEVGPTCHYMMGGIRVEAETAASTVPGLFAAGEAAAGLHGSNRLGGNSLSDLLVFGRRAGKAAAEFAAKSSAPNIDSAQLSDAEREMARAIRAQRRRISLCNPSRLQEIMGNLVGIFRNEEDLKKALVELDKSKAAARQSPHRRFAHVQSRLAPDPRPEIHAPHLRSSSPLRPGSSRKPWRAQPHRLSELRSRVGEEKQHHRERRRLDDFAPAPRSRNACGTRTIARGEGNNMAEALLRVFRGDKSGGQSVDYKVPLAPGMVVLDALHSIQAHQSPDLAVRWNCKAAKCGSCSAEVNGRPRLTCKTRMDALPLDRAHHRLAAQSFSCHQRSRHRRLLELQSQRKIPAFKPKPGVEWKMDQRDIDRVQEFRKCIECFLCQDVCHVLRDHGKHESFGGPRFFVRTAGLEMHPLDGVSRTALLKNEMGIGLLQHHQMLH